VRCADAGAGEHRHDASGIIGRKDPHHFALADAARLQRVAEALHVAVQFGVSDRALLALLAAPVEGHAVAVPGLDVTVDAVVGRVQPAPDEPLVERRVRLVEDGVPASVPVQRLRLLGPEALVVALGALVDRSVGDRGALAECVWGREPLHLHQVLELAPERPFHHRHAR
jgi:hypothetical protein